MHDSSKDVELIIEKHRAAMLARPSTEHIHAMKITGTYVFNGNAYSVTVRKMRPRYFRLDVATESSSMIQAFDGKRAWLAPLGSSPETDAQWMGVAESAAMKRDAAMFNYLLESNVDEVEIRRKPSPERPEQVCLEVEFSNGGLLQYWLNAETYMIEREVRPDYIDGQFKFRTIKLEDYREVDGVKVAHNVKHYVGGELESELNIDSIEIVDGFSPLIFTAPMLEEEVSNNSPLSTISR